MHSQARDKIYPHIKAKPTSTHSWDFLVTGPSGIEKGWRWVVKRGWWLWTMGRLGDCRWGGGMGDELAVAWKESTWRFALLFILTTAGTTLGWGVVPGSTGGGGGGEKSQAVAVGRKEVPVVLCFSRWLPIPEVLPKVGTAWTVLIAINGQAEH